MRIVPALATPQPPNVAAPRYTFSGTTPMRQAFVSLSDTRAHRGLMLKCFWFPRLIWDAFSFSKPKC